MADDEQWSGRIANLNIPLEGYPELFNELCGRSNRGRGHRMRFLAAFGLACLKSGGGPQVPSPAAHDSSDQVPTSGKEKESENKKEIKSKLVNTA